MGIGAFVSVHCVNLMTAFPQQSIHLPLVVILLYSSFCPLLVSLPVQASLRFPALLSPQCS